MDKTLLWLKQITEISGVSGFEQNVKNLLQEKLKDKAEISYDKLGSIIFAKKRTSQHVSIMLASHMDEIGFLVKNITKEGFIKFVTLGGWWEQVMLGQRINIYASKGNIIPGVIGSKPPHILTPEEKACTKTRYVY